MMRTRSAAAVFALGAAIALGACTAKTDLGRTCRMTAPCGSGTCAISPDKVSNDGADYIALGAAECDDLVCIRTAKSANPVNGADEARGYCTTPCIDDSNCSPNFEGKSNKLSCQLLILDQAFMDSYKQSDPAGYERTFGNGASSKYCILPSSAPR